jgi:hypothetical protein
VDRICKYSNTDVLAGSRNTSLGKIDCQATLAPDVANLYINVQAASGFKLKTTVAIERGLELAAHE